VDVPARTHTLAEAEQGREVTVAGRVMLVRDFGGVVFAVLRDWSGDHQLALTRDGSGPALDRFTADTDIGDHITATGHAGLSDRDEPTVFVTSWQLTGSTTPSSRCWRPTRPSPTTT
jgi:lysyl-tRNA synthetase class 2